MVAYVLWALLLYLLYIVAHGTTTLASSKGDENVLKVALGPRDNVIEKSVLAQRCARAKRNMEETLLFFLPLALLLIQTGKADGLAITGALLFVLARAAYLPAYITSVSILRSVIWAFGAVGLVLMTIRLLG